MRDVSRLLYLFFFCFFFFKQKTAYEMRISDWSSDVCSSDLQLFSCLEGVTDRWAITEDGRPAPLIFPNPQWARQQLGRLFAARHIIVHELPDDRSDEVADIADFVSDRKSVV